MNRTLWLRQMHRWVSAAFTVGVIINTVVIAAGHGQPAFWVYLLALVPLGLLLATGIYLFALPYAASFRRSRRGALPAGGR